jgi:AcrR family transcriptional regulator
MAAEVKRNYCSPRRREKAAATQSRIIASTRALLLKRGYAATTMADVAAAAGVAVQTVYSSTEGGKAALAKRVWDVTIAGDLDPVPLGDRPQFQELLAEPDPSRKLALYARLSRQIYQRMGTLARVLRAGAAAGDAELQQLIDVTERERLRGTTSLAAHLDAVGALPPGLTVERAGHRLWALNAPELADGLTSLCGWTLDEYQAWLAESMISALRITKLRPLQASRKRAGDPTC